MSGDTGASPHNNAATTYTYGDDGMPGARNVRRWLNRGDILILDTETTGLNAAAEVIEIAIVDTTGRLVLSELSMPIGDIPPQASAVNGLNRDVLIHELAREWRDIHDDVADALREASYVIAWNANFDERMLRQTANGGVMGSSSPGS